jgi:hypothetical protein
MTTDNFDPTHKFYVGQDVVCVDNGYRPEQRVSLPCELVLGAVYKVRWLGVFVHYLDGEYLGIKVEGLDRGEDPEFGYHDLPFRASRFRPVVNDPLASLKNIAADPDGYKPAAPNGPVRDRPTREGAPRRKVKEEV